MVTAQIAPPRGFPVQLTRFVGRERELAELDRLLRDSRLVTIAGTAGTGKSRLALELASRVLGQHPGGVWFAGLAAVAAPELTSAVATALGGPGRPADRPIAAFGERLGASRALLVLDGCEHLVAAAAGLVAAMMGACPGLRVLATSHEPLRIPGERVWRIGPLALPDGAAEPPFPEVARSDAVRLFEARACLVQPRFAISPANAAAVQRICRRLDGIPLAIELAAARTEMMSVGDILERLDDRFRLLTGGSRTSMPRHQTLRAALDWAHHLLNAGEQKLFRRLSVFADRFQSPAVEAVCAGSDLPPDEVHGVLYRLVDKSLVLMEAGAGPTRYHMLETVRAYAAGRLLESGEGAEVRRRHLDHFGRLAETAAAFERRPGQGDWLERLEAAHDDLRAALDWARDHDAPRRVGLATALGWFWLARGHLGEGGEVLEDVLRSPGLGGQERARALFQLARLVARRGDHAAARERAAECVAVCRDLGDDVQAGRALNLLGLICARAGDDVEARARLEESAATAAGDDARAEALIGLGELALLGGRPERARRAIERGLQLADGGDARWELAPGLLYWAVAEFFAGDHARSLELAAEGAAMLQQLGNRCALAGALDVLAALALAAGRPERALRDCAAAEAARDAMRAPLAPRWRRMLRTVVIDPARAAAGAGADAAWAGGARMALEDAVAGALAELSAPAGPPGLSGAGGLDGLEGPGGGGPLSPRERQVAALVAQGMKNRQIADRLGIAERTAEGHVERIRGKLGLHSRIQIAVWVVERSRPAGRS